MNLATWSIRNPIPVVLLFLLLSLAGIRGFLQLGVQDFPDLDLPAIDITLKLQGMAPAQLETEVARKVEDKLAGLRGLKNIDTTITEGQVSITAQFEIGTPLSDALLDTKDAVDSVRGDLPSDLEVPQVSKVSVGPGGPTLTYAVVSSRMDEEALSWFTDDQIARAVLAVPGVGRFSRVGGVQREVQVSLDPAQLDALGVTAGDVSRALRRTQQESSGGRGQIGATEQGLRTLATVDRVDALGTIMLPLPDGRRVELQQVATVRDTVAERTQAALLDGRPAVGIEISRGKGVDEIALEAGVLKAFAALQAAHPGLEFQRISSTVDHTRAQYHGSMEMLLEGALLAVVVIGFYLRDWRATLIGAAALPLSVLPTFAFMAWAGYALNTITLLALAVVVGVLVDDAIVEVENIARHARMGKTVRRATEDAVNEIWLAVLATTAALVVVFLPTAFMTGTAGLVFRQFGWTTVISVLASLLVARLATPVLAVWLLKPHDNRAPPTVSRTMHAYLGIATWCLHHRGITLLLALLLFAASLALVPLMTTGFIPASDKGTTTIDIELPPGAPLTTTLAAAEDVRRAIAPLPGVRRVFVTAGAPQSAGGPKASIGEVRKASIDVVLAGRATRPSQQAIENAMRPRLSAVPGIRWSISGGGPGEKLQLVLASQNPAALNRSAAMVEAGMRELPFLSGVTSGASLERPELIVHPDPHRAAEQGVTAEAIGDTLRIATSGDFTTSLAKFNLERRQLDIVVRLPDRFRQDAQALAGLRVSGSRGLVPLNSVATLSMGSGPSQISRYNRSRDVSISADLGGYPLSKALAAAKSLPAITALPHEVRLLETGDAELMRDLFLGFAIALATGVLCKYCVLVLLYKNWFQPFTNLSALPLSVGGALAALLAFSGELSLPALIGIVMLFGVVTKNSILIVDYAFMAMHERGLGEIEALLDACRKRARPVMMTTVAMIAGMTPLALGYGGDASFRQPMAIAVIGGLAASTVLSLLIVPVVSTYLSALERWLGSVTTRSAGARREPAAAGEFHAP